MCHYISKYQGLKHPCRRCLHNFSRANLLKAHENDFLGIGEKPQKIVIPEAGKNILILQVHAGSFHNLCISSI